MKKKGIDMKKLIIGMVLAIAAAFAFVSISPAEASAASGYHSADGYYNGFAYEDDHGRDVYIDHRGRYFWLDRYGHSHFVPRPRAHVAPHVYGHGHHRVGAHHNPGLLGFIFGY
jgi:hypothetical protein